MGKWLIPDGDAPSLESVTITLPADAFWASRFWGAFSLLAASHNWEETEDSTLTPEEAANVFLDCLWAGIQEVSGVIVGTIILWGAGVIPDGWLACDGQWCAQSEYPELFAVIGSVFGSMGSSFQVPDLGGRFPIGESDQYDLADEGGTETHQLTVDEMPAHIHHMRRKDTGGDAYASAPQNAWVNSRDWDSDSVGGGEQHNNMPPYLTLFYIIKVDD